MNALVTWHFSSLILTPTEFRCTWQLRLRYHFDQEFVSIWSALLPAIPFRTRILSYLQRSTLVFKMKQALKVALRQNN